MFEKLSRSAALIAAKAVERQIDRLAQIPAPPGVRIERSDDRITLSGKRLRRRMIDDASLRNFGR
jgi:hypothetical protein